MQGDPSVSEPAVSSEPHDGCRKPQVPKQLTEWRPIGQHPWLLSVGAHM
jgi:hypothetical protein